MRAMYLASSQAGVSPIPAILPVDSETEVVGRELRILLVDDHATFVRHIKRFLNGQEGMKVVGTASSAREGVEAARLLRPDLMLLDISMPGESGLDVIPELKAFAPAPRVIVVSMKDPIYGEHARALGADGFVHKSRVADDLVAAIRDAAGQ